MLFVFSQFIDTFSSIIYLLVMFFYQLLFLFRVYPFSILLQYQEMNFFKKISSKRISTAPDDCNNRKFKSKYAEHNPLPPSPPLLSKAAFLKQDNSLLELNIPDDFSSFDIPQLQSIHKRSVDIDRSKTDNTASIRIVKATHIVQNITAVDNTTTVCLEPFSKTETEQGTRMHTELNDPTATSVHATIPENHSELALEFTDK
jgi:hypothetical protein